MLHFFVFCRILVAWVFFIAALSKLYKGNFSDFVVSIRFISMIPVSWLRALATTVVSLEMSTVGFLVFPAAWATLTGFLIASLLLVTFTVVILKSLLQRTPSRCHCFGTTKTTFQWRHTLRNLMLLTACVIGFILTQHGEQVDAETLTAGGIVALISGTFVAKMDDIVDTVINKK